MDTKNHDLAEVSTELRYPSHYVKIKDSNLHYIEAGEGDPILFIHGIPASAYLWRNIFPALSNHGRCIAVDLIGMGKSDKPDIPYRIFDHIEYIQAFVDALNLKNVTYVLHGWGSVVGFAIAMRNGANTKAIAFYEAHVLPPHDWHSLSLPIQQFAAMLKDQDMSYRAIISDNYFINKILPRSVLRELTKEEIAHYREPFPTAESRKPLWQYVQDLPLGDGPADVIQLMEEYCAALEKSSIPKLMLYSIPGFVTTMNTVIWCREHLKNLSLVDLGAALHFAQETNPIAFRNALAEWYLSSVLHN